MDGTHNRKNIGASRRSLELRPEVAPIGQVACRSTNPPSGSGKPGPRPLCFEGFAPNPLVHPEKVSEVWAPEALGGLVRLVLRPRQSRTSQREGTPEGDPQPPMTATREWCSIVRSHKLKRAPACDHTNAASDLPMRSVRTQANHSTVKTSRCRISSALGSGTGKSLCLLPMSCTRASKLHI